MHDGTGIVFDLQRASLHDGPGIRTTVFLKGCVLQCAWCHNPESQALAPELAFDPTRCTGCRACVTACAHGVHAFDAANVHRVDFAACVAAGDCVRACPAGALRLHGAAMSVEAVMAEVRKDRFYYEASGGGLTLSGGEPTVQVRFCLALLRAARAEGIHTCVETCGFTGPETLAALLPLVDLFLFDYKATDPSRHEALTGRANTRILANLRWLGAHGAAIRLRCPLVPGVNDDLAHLRAIAALAREVPSIEAVELLPWHDTGDGKYPHLGRARPALATHVPDAAEQAAWLDIVTAAGCPVPICAG